MKNNEQNIYIKWINEKQTDQEPAKFVIGGENVSSDDNFEVSIFRKGERTVFAKFLTHAGDCFFPLGADHEYIVIPPTSPSSNIFNIKIQKMDETGKPTGDKATTAFNLGYPVQSAQPLLAESLSTGLNEGIPMRAVRHGEPELRREERILWRIIREAGHSLLFNNFYKTIENELCHPSNESQFSGIDGYKFLKKMINEILLNRCATEFDYCSIRDYLSSARTRTWTDAEMDEEIRKYFYKYQFPKDLKANEKFEASNYQDPRKYIPTTPYGRHLDSLGKRRVAGDEGERDCSSTLDDRLRCPTFIELIWSYWMEEGMLVQTMNAITVRFQNKLLKSGTDPLAHLNTSPLRRLNNLIWGYIQDEQNQLTVKRRAYEYDHHYGISLIGKVVPKLQASDSRTNFIESFHRLLYLCTVYFREVDDRMIDEDSFPVMNALRDLHIILAEGAHNQYGDLPWTARQEMIAQQYILSRPEMREFLGGRPMVPYQESWMEAVDTMKRLQNWGDTGVEQFSTLARLGEQILLSVRFDNWNDPSIIREKAWTWLDFWRNEIQQYIHSYRSVTGVDLTDSIQVDSSAPSVHLLRKTKLSRREAS